MQQQSRAAANDVARQPLLGSFPQRDASSENVGRASVADGDALEVRLDAEMPHRVPRGEGSGEQGDRSDDQRQRCHFDLSCEQSRLACSMHCLTFLSPLHARTSDKGPEEPVKKPSSLPAPDLSADAAVDEVPRPTNRARDLGRSGLKSQQRGAAPKLMARGGPHRRAQSERWRRGRSAWPSTRPTARGRDRWPRRPTGAPGPTP